MPVSSRRLPLLARGAPATSRGGQWHGCHRQLSNATRAGLRLLERGGNAADAVVAAAAMPCVAGPMNAGFGGDACALVCCLDSFFGLDATGPAAEHIADVASPASGPTLGRRPGGVAGWADLCARFGRRGLDAYLANAIDPWRDPSGRLCTLGSAMGR